MDEGASETQAVIREVGADVVGELTRGFAAILASFDRVGAAMEIVAARLSDLSDHSEAQTDAILRLLDRLGPAEGTS